MSALALDGATVSLSGKTVLQGVSFTAKAGAITGLIGPNGAGKTSAIRALMGQLPLQSGTARIAGQDPARLNPTELARQVAWLPQTRPLAWPVAVREIVALGRFAHAGPFGQLGPADQHAVDQALAECGLEHLATRSVASLSGGELARVHLARTLVSGTPCLIADEPTAALDPGQAFAIFAVLRAKAMAGAAVLVTVHDLPLAFQCCDEIVVLQDGQVRAVGPPAQTMIPSVMADVFGIEVGFNPTAPQTMAVLGPAA